LADLKIASKGGEGERSSAVGLHAADAIFA